VSTRSSRPPSYRLHKPSGQAVVTLGDRDIYLGRYNSTESRAEYDRIIAEWLAHGRRLPASASGRGGADPTVNELILAYLKFADGYYRKNGEPTSEPANLKLALRPLRRLYGHTPGREFGPLALKAVRQAMIDSGLCRNEVNKRIGKVVRAFKWAVAEEMVPPSVHHGLRAVSGLRKGRADVRESEPVRPVPGVFVEAIRPHVARQVWAMVELQMLTAMRPGEVCRMRTRDLDVSGPVWAYAPASHKTEHYGRQRRVFLGPRAQEVLRSWLRTDLAAFLFSPTEAMAERKAEMRRGRKTPVQPCQRCRAKARPAKAPGDVYTVESYRRAITYACKKAGVPKWHPNQLRHNRATEIRARFGLEAAQTVLGHAKADVTLVYAERDLARALAVMGEIG
jgi:integrase